MVRAGGKKGRESVRVTEEEAFIEAYVGVDERRADKARAELEEARRDALRHGVSVKRVLSRRRAQRVTALALRASLVGGLWPIVATWAILRRPDAATLTLAVASAAILTAMIWQMSRSLVPRSRRR